jgi:hypothetical protein
VSICHEALAANLRRQGPKRRLGELQSGNDERLARDHGGTGLGGFGNRGQSRGVACPDVFGEGGFNEAMNFIARKRIHGASMEKAND